MKVYDSKEMVRGWFLGNFEPSVYKTEDFEVGLLIHKEGEQWPTHYHKISTEINYLICGKMLLQGQELNSGDIFVIEPYEIADPIFLEDCQIICVKVPSSPSDKYIVKECEKEDV